MVSLTLRPWLWGAAWGPAAPPSEVVIVSPPIVLREKIEVSFTKKWVIAAVVLPMLFGFERSFEMHSTLIGETDPFPFWLREL